MPVRFWGLVLFTMAVFDRLTRASPDWVCPVASASDVVLGVRDSTCLINSVISIDQYGGFGVIEGDEASLQRALGMVYKKSHDYVVLLFYAPWCPFSASFRPMLSILSSLYPSIPHFAIEETAIRPSILSKYGVRGFPTLFLMNSTVRIQYIGSRTLSSLVAFYNEVSGLNTVSLDSSSLAKIILSSHSEDDSSKEPENCPFSWARSPENLFREETYLALAVSFVLLRLLYFIFPTLSAIAHLVWTLCIRNITLRSLLDHPRTYLNRAVQLFNYLKEPCKRSNLQEGAMNAKAWASKSLASVSFGETSNGL